MRMPATRFQTGETVMGRWPGSNLYYEVKVLNYDSNSRLYTVIYKDGTELELKESDITAKPPAAVKTTDLEFGGRVGVFFMMLLLPVAVLALLMLCGQKDAGLQNFPLQIPPLQSLWDWQVFGIVLLWILFQAVLALLPVGKVVEGMPLKNGETLKYRINGFYALVLTAVVVGVAVYQEVDLSYIHAHFLQFCTSALVIVTLLGIYLFVCSRWASQSNLAPGGNSGNPPQPPTPPAQPPPVPTSRSAFWTADSVQAMPTPPPPPHLPPGSTVTPTTAGPPPPPGPPPRPLPPGSTVTRTTAGSPLSPYNTDEPPTPPVVVVANSGGAKPEAARGNGLLPGGGGLMEEMSALLARRRRIAEKGSSPEPEQKAEEFEATITPKVSACSTPDIPRKPWERTNTMNGSKTPVIGRQDVPWRNQMSTEKYNDSLNRPRSTPTPTGSISANGVPTEALDYDRLKQDILEEMRKELSKLKEELIDAIREELGKSNSA